MNKSMGQEAYEATQQNLASNNAGVAIASFRSWEELPAVYREAWEAGAQAAILAHEVSPPKPFVAEFPSRHPHTGRPWTREEFEALSVCWPSPSGEVPKSVRPQLSLDLPLTVELPSGLRLPLKLEGE